MSHRCDKFEGTETDFSELICNLQLFQVLLKFSLLYSIGDESQAQDRLATSPISKSGWNQTALTTGLIPETWTFSCYHCLLIFCFTSSVLGHSAECGRFLSVVYYLESIISIISSSLIFLSPCFIFDWLCLKPFWTWQLKWTGWWLMAPSST